MSPTVAVYTVTSPPNPGLTPPPGVIPDFQDPYTLQPYLELECAAFIVITTAVVAARMFVKVRIVKKILWEDWAAIVGWVSNFDPLSTSSIWSASICPCFSMNLKVAWSNVRIERKISSTVTAMDSSVTSCIRGFLNEMPESYVGNNFRGTSC